METLSLEGSQSQTFIKPLSECHLFRALKSEHFPQILKIGELLRFDPDEVILRQGDPSDSFLVVVQGEASVRIKNSAGEEVEVGRVPLPSSVGEIGLLLNEPRTASVIALTDVQAIRFNAKAFEAMFQKIPNFGVGLAGGLAYRLQQVSGKVPLPQYDLKKGAPNAETLALLPIEMIQRHRALPLSVSGNALTLGLVDDPSSALLNAVHELLPSMELRTVKIDAKSFDEVLHAHSGIKGWRTAAAPAAAAAAPRSPRLDQMLERMVAEGASDLHLAAGHKPIWRIDGDIRAIEDAPILGPTEVLDLLAPVMESRHSEQFQNDSDTDFAYSLPGVARFRVNLYRDRNGVCAAMRRIPSTILTAEQLGLPPVIKTLCDMPKGLLLVTGPTGCGKSTTLAAMIDYINRTRKVHIVTLEDPIEFVHQSDKSLVNQREVGGHTKSFARALRAALREDPNIVLVGEMRDLETISLALETANTGHLVLGTLHTNTAISTVDRIVDQYPQAQQAQVRSVLADVLRGVVCQTLCKKIGGGRVAALEILVVNFAIGNLIRESKTVQIPSIIQANRGIGMALLNDELTRLVEAKKIEMAEALSRSVDKDDLQKRFRSGVTLTTDNAGQLRVAAVVADSPSAECGLQRGDAIVEIENQPAGNFDLEQARIIVRSEGRHMITVERGGKRIKLTLEIKR